ncbi:MAG TPA: nitrilase-related carbon-nitrogen hydrolase [Ktedonobacteraceae bacterium]|nr:nitrilase-related carbon-nitrogen hydrolase [Ktedonobacteraceae bacterium]
MNTLRIGLVQMRCEKGAIDDNLAAIQSYLQAGASRNIDIMCFPEMSITGYANPQTNPWTILHLNGPEVARFVVMTKDIPVTAIAGLIEANPEEKPFITQIVARGGKLQGVYRKKTIIDEETNRFAPGSIIQPVQHPKVPFGISICADINTPEIFTELARLGAHIVFEAAAPGLYGSQETRNWRSGYEWWQSECHQKLGRYARENGIFIAVATQAGRTIDEDFPGGGYVFAPDGTCLFSTENWSEGVLYAELPVR